MPEGGDEPQGLRLDEMDIMDCWDFGRSFDPAMTWEAHESHFDYFGIRQARFRAYAARYARMMPGVERNEFFRRRWNADTDQPDPAKWRAGLN